MPWRLVIQLDDRALRLPLPHRPLVLGSAEDCDLHVPHFTVSRRHALLEAGPDRVQIRDLDSSNGTGVDGRRIDEPVELDHGTPVAFGSVEGRLERVAPEEMEPAVRVGPGGASGAGSDRAVAPEEIAGTHGETTISLGSLKRLALQVLPGLLERARELSDARRLAPAVGAALLESLPCTAVEVITSSGGVQFRAGEPPDGAEPPWLEAATPDGGLTVRVAFLSPGQGAVYDALVRAAADLLALADRPPREPGDRPSPAPGDHAPPRLPDPPSIVPQVRGLYADTARVARGDVSVLICGESGTGKEVLARYVHAASGRAKGFVALNCAALPRDLLEAELFGVEERAATGVAARPGKFELAHGGTLFLDEIGDMALETQAKILRALQEGEVYRLGGRAPHAAEARIVSATNRPVEELLAEGAMRSDLYHRIADWRVELPPLRHRRADIPNLAAHFLEREARRRSLRSVGISRAAMDALEAYRWPGNIRQLEREMARVALFLDEGDLVETAHLQEEIRRGGGASRHGPAGAGSLRQAVEETERREIVRALDACGGDTRAAAELLGIGRSTLYRKMDALGIDVPGS